MDGLIKKLLTLCNESMDAEEYGSTDCIAALEIVKAQIVKDTGYLQ